LCDTAAASSHGSFSASQLIVSALSKYIGRAMSQKSPSILAAQPLTCTVDKIRITLHIITDSPCVFHCVDAPTGALTLDVFPLTLADTPNHLQDNSDSNTDRGKV
jgi:hypothetical protein